MSQPPLSRAIRQLENELRVSLLERTSRGVVLTEAGETLQRHARSLLEHADRVGDRVSAASGTPVLTVGIGADTAEVLGTDLVHAFRSRHAHVDVRLHESDLTDPTAGLRTDLVDVALTRGPFDDTGIDTRVLRSGRWGVVVRADDPIAGRASTSTDELADRRWIRLPEGTDPIWTAHCTGGPSGPDRADSPVLRTIQECVQSVLWSDATTLAPLDQAMPEGLVVVPVTDRAPSSIVVAWRPGNPDPLVRSFVGVAVETHRAGAAAARSAPSGTSPA